MKSLKFVPLTLLIAGCASTPTSVLDLPKEPKPMAPVEAMGQLPDPSHFQTKLKEIFAR